MGDGVPDPAASGRSGARRVLDFLRREIREVIPPTLFFYVAFGLLLITQALVLAEHGIELLDFGAAALGALMVGKILLIVDKFRFVDRFPDRPLIYNTLWKALLYNLAALIFRYAEAVIPLAIDKGGFLAGNEALFAAIAWPRFILVQLWLAVLLVVYCAARELFRKLGPGEVRALFFGRRKA